MLATVTVCPSAPSTLSTAVVSDAGIPLSRTSTDSARVKPHMHSVNAAAASHPVRRLICLAICFLLLLGLQSSTGNQIAKRFTQVCDYRTRRGEWRGILSDVDGGG